MPLQQPPNTHKPGPWRLGRSSSSSKDPHPKAGRTPFLTTLPGLAGQRIVQLGQFLIWNLATRDQEQGLSFLPLSSEAEKEAGTVPRAPDSGPLWGWGGGYRRQQKRQRMRLGVTARREEKPEWAGSKSKREPRRRAG